MKFYFRAAGKIGIILFCLWHMFAIAVYAVPGPANDAVATWIKEHLDWMARPYIYATSQWQQWNLFSPDPMRRATEYYVYINEDGVRWPAKRIDRDTLPWWRAGRDLTIIRRVEDYKNPYRLWQRYLQTFCGELHSRPGMSLELGARYQILRASSPGETWWVGRIPTWTPYWGARVTCEETERAADTVLP